MRRKDEELNITLVNRFLAIFLPIVLIYLITSILKDWNIKLFVDDIFDLFNPIIIALVITWILNPLVKFFQKNNIRKSLSTIIAFMIFFFSVYLILVIFIPVFVEQIIDFVNYTPKIQYTFNVFFNDMVEKISQYNSSFDATELELQFSNTISGLLGNIGDYLLTISTEIYGLFTSLVNAIYNFFFALMISFYLLYDYDRVVGALVHIFPKRHEKSVAFLVDEFTIIVGNYIRSYSLISLIVTILVYICFSFLRLSSPLVLALIIGIFNFVPMIGPFVGAIPALLVALSMGWGTAIITVIVVTIVQQIDANVLKPLLMGKSTNLHPLIIIISIMVFGKFFGIVGILVAIPVTAFINSLLHYFKSKGVKVSNLFSI